LAGSINTSSKRREAQCTPTNSGIFGKTHIMKNPVQKKLKKEESRMEQNAQKDLKGIKTIIWK